MIEVKRDRGMGGAGGGPGHGTGDGGVFKKDTRHIKQTGYQWASFGRLLYSTTIQAFSSYAVKLLAIFFFSADKQHCMRHHLCALNFTKP